MREYTLRGLLQIILAICLGSFLLHTLIFQRKQELHYRHFAEGVTPTPADFLAAGPPVEGSVSAVGMGKLHLNTGSKLLTTFLVERAEDYQVGQRLRVTYAPGTPPTALKIEVVKP